MRGQLRRLIASPAEASFARIWAAMTLEERAAGLRYLLEESAEKWLDYVTQWIAESRHFRVQTVNAWSVEKIAGVAAGLPLRRNSGVIVEAMVALHMHDRSEMLCSFLDRLQVPH